MTILNLSPDVTIYHGDFMDILPTLAGVDAVITDPPYSSGGMYRGDRAMTTRDKYTSTGAEAKYAAAFSGDNRDQRSFALWCSFWLGYCLRASNAGAVLAMFSDWRQLPTVTDALQTGGWVWRGVAGWAKPTARPVPDRMRQALEFIAWGTKGARVCRPHETARYHAGLYHQSAPSGKGRLHATEKPVELLEDLVAMAPPGGLVLDPFMGSGSTGEACIRTGRRFIGVEVDAHYFEVARRRLERALAQPGLGIAVDGGR